MGARLPALLRFLPNSQVAQMKLIETGRKLISKKKYRSKSALSKALDGCDIRGRAFLIVWGEHEKKYGCDVPKPKAIELTDSSLVLNHGQDELDKLIDEQKKDHQSDNLHRRGKRVGNRRIV